MPSDTPVISLDLVLAESNQPLAVDPGKAALVETLRPMLANIAVYRDGAAALKVNTPEQANEAAVLLERINGDIKTVQTAVKDFKVEANRRHSLWCDLEALFVEPFTTAYKDGKRKVADFQIEQERKAEAERARLQAGADEAARKERERLEKLAESRKTPECKERYQEQAAFVQAPVIQIPVAKAPVKMQTRWKVKTFDPVKMGIPMHLIGFVTVETTKLERMKAANAMYECVGVVFHRVTV